MKNQLNESMPFAGLTVGQVRQMLEDMLARETKIVSTMPEVIGIDEVSRLTGYTQATIYKLVHERKIPFHKPPHGGRKLFFITAEINEWLRANRVETNDEFVKNHRRGRSAKSKKRHVKLKQCLDSLKKARLLMELSEATIEYQQVTIAILENQVAQDELQIKILTKK